MNKYTELSDFEINKKVAEALGIEHDYVTFQPFKRYTFDPCNNPADAMPIIIENKIDINHGDNVSIDLFGWHSCTALLDFKVVIAADSKVYGDESKTIYRLGMEVFLMMKEVENES